MKDKNNDSVPLADLPVGAEATIIKILPNMRGRKKFADVGIMAGADLILEAKSLFGGLLRVRVMETSMAFHARDAKNILTKVRKNEKAI